MCRKMWYNAECKRAADSDGYVMNTVKPQLIEPTVWAAVFPQGRIAAFFIGFCF